MSNVRGLTFFVVHESQDHPSPAPWGRGTGRSVAGAEEVGADWLTLWLGSLGPS